MSDTTVTIDGNVVYTQRPGERTTSTCATRRVAQVFAATTALRGDGWIVSPIRSSDRPRLPLMLPGERIGRLLDGALSDRRAQGFVARRGDSVLGVDACAGMPTRFFDQSGDISDAIEMCHWYLGE